MVSGGGTVASYSEVLVEFLIINVDGLCEESEVGVGDSNDGDRWKGFIHSVGWDSFCLKSKTDEDEKRVK